MRNRKSKRSTVPSRVADEEGPLRHDDPPQQTPWHDNAIRQPFTWTADRDAIIKKVLRGKLALHDLGVAR
jgi:hypothetical protein